MLQLETLCTYYLPKKTDFFHLLILLAKMRFFIILLTLLFFIIPAYGYYPSGVVKLHNAKIQKSNSEKLGDQWLEFLDEKPEILKSKTKNFKEDQYCKFSAQLNNDGQIILDSLKLLKHKNNFQYNLRAIEFLRANNPKFKIKDFKKLIEIEFKYFAF
jgi:hypothetical protein